MSQNLKKAKNKFLITGASSGLGKYLHDQLGGISYNRTGTNVGETEVIIHSAFNRAKEVNSNNLYQYLSDNIFLTKKLVSIPHKKFIYISTVDVYPKDNKKHSEDEVIDVNQVSEVYGISKLMSESIVRNFCPDFLILRCSALLGKDSRDNSLIKISKEPHPTVSLSSKSVFNYILHTDVLEFIKMAIVKDLQGVYNLASSRNISLPQIATLCGKKVSFGDYIYSIGEIDASKASSIFPAFKKTSKQVILEYIKERVAIES